MTERIRITLPLSIEQRTALAATLPEYVKVRAAAEAEYDKVLDAAWAEYDKVLDAAWAEYVKVLAAARMEYVKVRDAAWAEYVKVRDAARAECVKVCDAALAEYDKTRDASPLVMWIVADFLRWREREAMEVLSLLAGGATLEEIKEHAHFEGWCKAWTGALSAALDRFEIVDEVPA